MALKIKCNVFHVLLIFHENLFKNFFHALFQLQKKLAKTKNLKKLIVL